MRELKPNSREEWLDARRQMITATDAPAILGVSPYGGALKIYSEKVTGNSTVEETERMRFGRRLEAPIIEEYTERTGRRANAHGRDISRHGIYPFIGATLDADQVDPKRGQGVLEIKTTEWLDEEEEPPLHWQVQVQHQMMVTNMNWASIACLVRGNKLVYWDLEKEAELQKKMLKKELDFWQRVERKLPPEAGDGSEYSAAAIKSLFPREVPDKVISFGPDEMALVAAWELAKATAKDAGKMEAQLKQQVQLALGDNELGLLPDGSKLSWKTQTRTGYTVQDSQSRVLRHLKGKSK